MALFGKTRAGRRRPARPPGRPRLGRAARTAGAAGELDQITELERALSSRPQHFQLQFLGEVDDAELTIRRETNIWAADASAAANVAAAFPWPEGALRMRILDEAGRVVFKRLKPKRT